MRDAVRTRENAIVNTSKPKTNWGCGYAVARLQCRQTECMEWNPYATRTKGNASIVGEFVYGKCINEVGHDTREWRKEGQEAKKRRQTLS